MCKARVGAAPSTGSMTRPLSRCSSLLAPSFYLHIVQLSQVIGMQQEGAIPHLSLHLAFALYSLTCVNCFSGKLHRVQYDDFHGMGSHHLLQVSSKLHCRPALSRSAAGTVSRYTFYGQAPRCLCMRVGAGCAGDSAEWRCPLRSIARQLLCGRVRHSQRDHALGQACATNGLQLLCPSLPECCATKPEPGPVDQYQLCHHTDVRPWRT